MNKKSIKNAGIGMARGFMFVITLYIFFLAFRWLGLKGFAGFIIGIGVTAYLMLSKNWIVRGLINMTGSDDYIDALRKK